MGRDHARKDIWHMTALFVFKGWTVDPRLREFRKADPDYGMRVVPFASRTGRQLRRDMGIARDALEAVKLRMLEQQQGCDDELAEFRQRSAADEADYEWRLTRMECRTETYAVAAALVEEEQARYVV
jgi:hypothetical protein